MITKSFAISISLILTIFILKKNENYTGLDSTKFNTSDSTLVWKSSLKLTWKDFLGDVPKSDIGIKNAVTCSEIVITADFYEGEMPNFIVTSVFHKNQSWAITDSEDVLYHEQAHFDISELYARKIRKVFNQLKNDKETNHEKYIENYYTLRKQELDYQNKYDNEVYFRKENQKKWLKNIANQLEELKEYEYIPETD